MRWIWATFGVLVLVGLPLVTSTSQTSPPYLSPGYRQSERGLTSSERAGRAIWFYATAGNDRFLTYTFQQRLGVMIDWFRVLNSESRSHRFKTWGLINDPDCCTPGSPNCPATSLDDTYGFDWCPGDETLLGFVGKPGYRDPACDLEDAPLAAEDKHGPQDQRQSACDLAFGTSTGVVGFRKFPNPRFNVEQWRRINEDKRGTWAGYHRRLSQDPARSDARMSRLWDASIEPPFRIGIACGGCHVAFDPLSPPEDTARPTWANIDGTVGNQYLRISEIFVSGMPSDSLEWQVFTVARPGAVDTSAIATDQVNNPGTMNAIINIARRPRFLEDVDKWRKTTSCPVGASERTCWCEPGRAGKCWEKSVKREEVHHILKGGEDSIGDHEAVQRVYFSIGSCAEACWVNHLTNLRELDPAQRGFGQTPFDIGQCRRDCPNFRAIEDRLGDIVNFLLTGRPTDLAVARGLKDQRDLVEQLDREFGAGAVARGRLIFAEHCARCHSSQAEPFLARDFRAPAPAAGPTTGRADWLGNDRPTPVSEVGTHRSRALHSNHITGHLWEEYASLTYRQRPPEANVNEPADGGRGYYRNVSLLSVWAHAPFMHNNAIGPELCGAPGHPTDPYRSSYVDRDGTLLVNPPPCWAFDPSVKGRYELYKASMEELLNPGQRIPKMSVLNVDVPLPIGPKFWDGAREKRPIGFELVLPKGTRSGILGNFLYKQFVIDLVVATRDPEKLKAKYATRFGPAESEWIAHALRAMSDEIRRSPRHVLESAGQRLPLLLRLYSTSAADIENGGHRFGEGLPDRDKKALIAFLATL
ncbi:MAG: cytochrome c [Candidatus Rokuibacteriota bacterium]